MQVPSNNQLPRRADRKHDPIMGLRTDEASWFHMMAHRRPRTMTAGPLRCAIREGRGGPGRADAPSERKCCEIGKGRCPSGGARTSRSCPYRCALAEADRGRPRARGTGAERDESARMPALCQAASIPIWWTGLGRRAHRCRDHRSSRALECGVYRGRWCCTHLAATGPAGPGLRDPHDDPPDRLHRPKAHPARHDNDTMRGLIATSDIPARGAGRVGFATLPQKARA